MEGTYRLTKNTKKLPHVLLSAIVLSIFINADLHFSLQLQLQKEAVWNITDETSAVVS